jgi:hypothetical protein
LTLEDLQARTANLLDDLSPLVVKTKDCSYTTDKKKKLGKEIPFTSLRQLKIEKEVDHESKQRQLTDQDVVLESEEGHMQTENKHITPKKGSLPNINSFQVGEEEGVHFVSINRQKVKTRVLCQASDEKLVQTDGATGDEDESLSDILGKLVGSDGEDQEEEFDFDRESMNCKEQLSQIKDAYTLEMPEGGEEKRCAKEGEGQSPGETESTPFQKLLYFTSVAATTGFYFLMRKHHII